MPKKSNQQKGKERRRGAEHEACSPTKQSRRAQSQSSHKHKAKEPEGRKENNQNVGNATDVGNDGQTALSTKPTKCDLSALIINVQGGEHAGTSRRDWMTEESGRCPKRRQKEAGGRNRPDCKNMEEGSALIQLTPKKPVAADKRRKESEVEEQAGPSGAEEDKLLEMSESTPDGGPPPRRLSSASTSPSDRKNPPPVFADSLYDSILADLNPELLASLIGERMTLQQVPMLEESPQLSAENSELDGRAEDNKSPLKKDVMWGALGGDLFRSAFGDLKTVQDMSDDWCGQVRSSSSGVDGTSSKEHAFDITEDYAHPVKKKFYKRKLVDESMNSWYRRCLQALQKAEAHGDNEDTEEDNTVPDYSVHDGYQLAEEIWNMNKGGADSLPSVDDVLAAEREFISADSSEPAANLGAILESISSMDSAQQCGLNCTFEPSEFLGSSTPIKTKEGDTPPKGPDTDSANHEATNS